MKQNVLKLLTLLSIVYALSGCAATQIALSKKNLDVQTKNECHPFSRSD